MNSANVPERWFDTLEESPVVEWLDDEDFPFTTTKAMIRYLKGRRSAALKRLLVQENDIPQSFAHWWCHTRVSRRQGSEGPMYAMIEKWLSVCAAWKNADTTPVDIIGTFKVWLDILFIDLSVYEDERQRPNVPRLYGQHIRWHHGINTVVGPKTTRLDAVEFIMAQGLVLFQERGWKEGETYWKSECNKYLGLC